MTDNEIIKALECVIGKNMYCRNCPYTARYPMPKCREQCAKDALDLINRQKAEIEISKTKSFKQQLKKELHRLTVEEIKAEAIKDFAERLKGIGRQDGAYGYIDLYEIDNIVKEMIGGNNESIQQEDC